DARDAAAALAQRLEIARGLGADQPREAERPVRDLQLLAVVLDHLEEESRVRAALVQLAGRVEVPRAEAARDDAPSLRSGAVRQRGDPLFRIGRWLDKCLDGDIIAWFGPGKQLLRRRFGLELHVVPGEHLIRAVLRRLHVGLVEGIDAEDGA